MLLLPEILTRPFREADDAEVASLGVLLGRLDLLPVDRATAELAVVLGAAYRLRAADAVHLATAVGAGADRFLTNNTRDFPQTITEIEVTYPADLPEPPMVPAESAQSPASAASKQGWHNSRPA